MGERRKSAGGVSSSLHIDARGQGEARFGAVKTKPGAGGIAPSTLIRVCRDDRWMTINAGELQTDDFVLPGFGRNSWPVEAVERVRSSVPGWKLVVEGGIELECANGTVLAGFAGPDLPSDPGAGAALAFIRHPVNTREARRRFRVRLLNVEKDDRPAIRRLLGSRRRYGTRVPQNEKVFYYYEQAVAFLTACKKADPTIRAFSAVDVTSYARLGRPDRSSGWQIAGKRSEREVIFPLFHLDEDSPSPVGVPVLDEFHWRGEWRPVKSCRRLDKPSEWIVPVFAERDGRAWRDEGDDEARSCNPLMIAAGQVPVFMADPFVNQRAYELTACYGKKSLVRIKAEPPRLYHLDDVAENVPPDASTPITEAAAADELWALFARMAGTGVKAAAVLERLKKRHRNEVWKKTPRK